jgi:hypothetical protein
MPPGIAVAKKTPAVPLVFPEVNELTKESLTASP